MRITPWLSLAAIAAAAAALNGCATLNEEQCLVGDWAGIGYQDGAEGYSHDRLADHAEACARHSVVPDPVAYEDGRERGLLRYCTDWSGFAAGRRGLTYRGVCPADLEGAFLYGFADGRIVYDVQQAYETANNERDQALHRARSIENEVRDAERRLADEETPDAERDSIRERLRRLRADRERALDEAEEARWRRDAAEREMSVLRSRFVRSYGDW